MSEAPTLDKLVTVSPRFARSASLVRDVYRADGIDGYILTPTGREVLRRLIVDTYLKHVPGRKAVAFCVNIRHGESLAELFRHAGVPARSVSGRMPRADREKYLAQFHQGELRVLCACDILNEGWDCPDVEVLLMARPTLSRVIYMQQIGRGTRKAPGKECLAFPVSPGHTLVLSRRHVADFFELSRAEVAGLTDLVFQVQRRLAARLCPGGFNVGVNVGAAAGQTIMHVHVHVIPRYLGDLPQPQGGVRNVIPGKGRYR
jgi:diadenosine tetraphosphate (Ap4A) HIT family hydrolase